MSIDPNWQDVADRITEMLEVKYFPLLMDASIHSTGQLAYNLAQASHADLVHELAAAYTRGLLDGLMKSMREETF